MSLLVSIEHSFEELGVILTALAERLFKEVAGLIAKIHMSAQALAYVAGSPFTPYAQLTESQVQGWVVDAMGPTQVAALEANIDGQIQQQITPTSVNLPPPWSAQPAQG